MQEQRKLSSGWETFDVTLRDESGNLSIRPFSAMLASSGVAARPAITKMRMVQDLGWPEAKRVFKDDRGRPRIVKKDEVIWLLKCKPSCWRLYFYVFSNHIVKQIIYLNAVCKKEDEEDPQSLVEARRLYDGIRPGGSGISVFEFPTS
jgi:hypothetical protein